MRNSGVMNGVQARTGGKCRVGVIGAIGRMCEKKGIKSNVM